MTTTVPFDRPHPPGRTDRDGVFALDVRGLARRFGGTTVLDRIDLTVGIGERVGIWGPNGSGKTTLLRCLAGTVTPSDGSALVFGHPAGSQNARQALGVLLGQERAFYSRLSGRHNLLFTARLRMRPEEADPAVAVICDELALDSFVDTPVERYSSGMRARLAIGRSLLGHPRVVLLDEPTRSLDDPASRLVWAALDRRPDLTVVVASPRRDDLRHCSRVIDLPGFASPTASKMTVPPIVGAVAAIPAAAIPATSNTAAGGAAMSRVVMNRLVTEGVVTDGAADDARRLRWWRSPLAPAVGPGAMSAIAALVRRDVTQRRVVRFALALDLVFGALNLVVYKFIGQVMHGSSSGSIARAGGYFSFASVGIAFFLVIQTATTGITRQVRDEVRNGTLELEVAQPVGFGSLALGTAGFPFAFATARALVYLLLAAVLGLDISHADWSGVVVTLVAAAPAMAAIGIVLAALALVIERGDVVGRFVAFGLGFLSGAYFPVTEFAPPLRSLSAALPTRYALDGLRGALAGGAWWPSAGALVAFDLAIVPTAMVLFAGALRWARREGRLTRG